MLMSYSRIINEMMITNGLSKQMASRILNAVLQNIKLTTSITKMRLSDIHRCSIEEKKTYGDYTSFLAWIYILCAPKKKISKIYGLGKESVAFILQIRKQHEFEQRLYNELASIVFDF